MNNLLLKNVEIHKRDGCNLRTFGSNRPYFPCSDSPTWGKYHNAFIDKALIKKRLYNMCFEKISQLLNCLKKGWAVFSLEDLCIVIL